MSDANVSFHRIDDDGHAEPGSEQVFCFRCPKHNRRCGELVIKGRTDLAHNPQGQGGGVAQWSWDGNRDAPTFTPSVNCHRCWHGYITNGRCVDTQGKDEPEC